MMVWIHSHLIPVIQFGSYFVFLEQEVMSSESRDTVRPHPPTTPLSSSSSRRSSVADMVTMATEGEHKEGGGRERGVVEWRAAISSSHDNTATMVGTNRR